MNTSLEPTRKFGRGMEVKSLVQRQCVQSAISIRSGSIFGGGRQREISTTDSQSSAAKKAWIESNAGDRTTTSVVGADLESQKTANGNGISVERSFHSRETAT
jgi:hypothetical protein